MRHEVALEMGVGPPGAALRGEASNHRKVRRSSAGVLSVAAKGAGRRRQVRIEKANESEPLMTHREAVYSCRNRGWLPSSGQAWKKPAYWPGGMRCKGGASSIQALVQNVGTCPSGPRSRR